MRNLFIVFLFMMIASVSYSQTTIVGGAGVCHVAGNPNSATALTAQDPRGECHVAWDTLNAKLYVYNNTLPSNKWSEVPLSQTVNTDTRVDSVFINGGNLSLRIRDMVGNTVVTTYTLPLIDIAPVRNVVAGSGISVSNSSGTFTITATDVAANNEGVLGVNVGAANSSIITSNTTGANGVTLWASGLVSLVDTANANGGSIRINVNAQTLSVTQNASNAVLAISDASSPITFSGSGITVGVSGSTVTFTAADGSATNEIQTLGYTGTSGTITLDISQSTSDVTFVAGTGITLGATATALTITAVDQSATNEGSLTVGNGTATTSLINSNTSGSTAVTLEATTTSGLTLTESGNTISIAAVVAPAATAYASTNAAGTGGVAVGSYFYASIANEMGVVPGTLIRRMF